MIYKRRCRHEIDHFPQLKVCACRESICASRILQKVCQVVQINAISRYIEPLLYAATLAVDQKRMVASLSWKMTCNPILSKEKARIAAHRPFLLLNWNEWIQDPNRRSRISANANPYFEISWSNQRSESLLCCFQESQLLDGTNTGLRCHFSKASQFRSLQIWMEDVPGDMLWSSPNLIYELASEKCDKNCTEGICEPMPSN